MKKPTAVTRRHFLAGTASALAFPTIIPASALGKDGRPAPSERITMGVIGFGTIAHSTVRNFLQDDRVQVVAIADPNKGSGSYGYSGEKQGGQAEGKKVVEAHYGEANATDYKGCNVYDDFRVMLEKEDVDTVNVSTPDHWHALCAIYAARKGIHVYGQKPVALTIAEGRAMATEIAKAGITFQTGSQQRSDVYFRMVAEYIRNGRLGTLKPIKVGFGGGHSDWNQQSARKAAEPVPVELNYDLWEGPAPHRDFCPAILPLNWRHNFDYSGGMITDWGAHHIDIVQWALGMDESGPVRIENIKGTLPDPGELYNTAGTFHFECVYADGTRLHVNDNSDPSYKQGIQFEGEDGKSIYVKRGKMDMQPVELRKERIQDDEIRLKESKTHEGDFIDCVFSGETPVAPIEAAHRTISIAHLANIGLRLGRESLDWDPKTETVKGDAEAQAMLSRPMRDPYSLS
jgi:predicted dehydrogenase